jgi:cell division septal protein FtsQ
MRRTVSSFQSKRLQARKRKGLAYKYGGLVVFVFIIVAGIAFLTHANFLRATEVVVEGNRIVEKSWLEGIARGELNDSYLGIFSKANTFLYPRQQVEQKISEQYKSIASVSASFDGLKKVLIKVTEFEPDYLWCVSESQDQCFFMTRDAYVFSESADFSKNIIFTYYGLIDSTDPVGKTYMPREKFSAINEFIESTKELGIAPVGLAVRSEGDYELFLEQGGSVLFSDRESFLTAFENLETITTEQSKIDSEYLKNLDYIDVRFTSKAFIKMKTDH